MPSIPKNLGTGRQALSERECNTRSPLSVGISEKQPPFPTSTPRATRSLPPTGDPTEIFSWDSPSEGTQG